MKEWDLAEISSDNQSVNLVRAVLLNLMDFLFCKTEVFQNKSLPSRPNNQNIHTKEDNTMHYASNSGVIREEFPLRKLIK